VLVDENMTSYVEVYNWLESLVVTPSNNKNKIIADDENVVDITLSILSSHNNVVKKIRYIDCVVTNIGTLLLEASGTETPVITFPVNFKISYFELV
jgi:lipid A disaccharide synthetase